ncbi:MAG TPA: EamA family transporter [Ignavibacteriaceae bacterium]|nr:EamA family transporter [Ignavibacteriaceae bacterium]
MENGNTRIVGTYILLCLIWGTTWVGIKASLESLTPFMSAGTRFILASLVIYLIMQLKKITLQTDKLSIKLYFLMGFFSFIIPFGLVYWAQQFVPSGLSAVLFAVYPFFVAIFSYFRIPEEKIGLIKVTGIIIGFTGIIVIFSDSFGEDLSDYILGMIAIVLSGAMQANIAVTLKKFGKHLNSLSMNLVPMLLAGFFMTLFSFIWEDIPSNVIDFNAVLSVSYLAVFGSVVTFTSFYWLLKRVNVIILSLIAFITPIVALIAGWIFYNEQLTERHFIGSGLVLLGLLWANMELYLRYRKAGKK